MRPKAMRCGAVLILAVLLLTACDGGSGASGEGLPSPGTAVGGSESPTATPTATAENDATKPEKYADVPTDLSLSEKEKVAAREALVMVDDYYASIFDLMKSGGKDDKNLNKFASDSALKMDEETAADFRRDKYRATGGYELRNHSVTDIDLDISDGTTIPFVKVSTCLDQSRTDVIDEKGDSVVSADRPDTTEYTFVVAFYDESARVSQKIIQGASC